MSNKPNNQGIIIVSTPIETWFEEDFQNLDARGWYAQEEENLELEDEGDECPMFGPFATEAEAIAACLSTEE